MLTFRGTRARPEEPGVVRFADLGPGGSSEILVNEGSTSFRWGTASEGARSMCESIIFMTVVALPTMTAGRARSIARRLASDFMWQWAVALQDDAFEITADEVLIGLQQVGFTHREGMPLPTVLDSISPEVLSQRVSQHPGVLMSNMPMNDLVVIARVHLEALRAILRERSEWQPGPAATKGGDADEEGRAASAS